MHDRSAKLSFLSLFPPFTASQTHSLTHTRYKGKVNEWRAAPVNNNNLILFNRGEKPEMSWQKPKKFFFLFSACLAFWLFSPFLCVCRQCEELSIGSQNDNVQRFSLSKVQRFIEAEEGRKEASSRKRKKTFSLSFFGQQRLLLLLCMLLADLLCLASFHSLRQLNSTHSLSEFVCLSL